MRQTLTEYISKVFVRQQMKVEKARFNHRRKMYFLFENSAVLVLFLFSLASLSIPTSVPTYSVPIFSLGSIKQSFLQAQVSIPTVSKERHS